MARLMIIVSLFVLAVALLQLRRVQVWGDVAIAKMFIPPLAGNGTIASSPGSSPNPQWSTLLGNLLWRFDAQRSGKLPTDNRVPWRNDSCLDDGALAGVDLVGGYYNAGSYIKATYPLAFTLTCLAWAGFDTGKGFDISSQTPYLDRTLRWGLDWLMKAHPNPNSLYVQVGDATQDFDYWGGDQGIPKPRNVFHINTKTPGTDVAASTAAAFAAAAVLYQGSPSLINSAWSGNSKMKDSAYAHLLLDHAQDLFHFANSTSVQIEYSKSVPEAAVLYPSSGFKDDLVWGALWLYLATNASSYLDFATSTFESAGLNTSNSIFNWDDKMPGAIVLMIEILHSKGQDISPWQMRVEYYFDTIIHQEDRDTVLVTPGGLLYFPYHSDVSALNLAANIAMLMLRYAPFASSSKKASFYRTFALIQSAYCLGKNPMNRPYIVGVHPNSPVNPQSAMASGGHDIKQVDISPKAERYVLYGAVVTGPDGEDDYLDQRSLGGFSGVDLDNSAPFVALAAYSLATGAADPAYVGLRGGPIQPTIKATSSVSWLTEVRLWIIILVVFAVALVAANTVLIVLCCKKPRGRPARPKPDVRRVFPYDGEVNQLQLAAA